MWQPLYICYIKTIKGFLFFWIFFVVVDNLVPGFGAAPVSGFFNVL